MDQRKMSRTARPGPSSGGLSQTRKRRPDWLVKMEDGGQEDRVQAWQGQVGKDEKKDHVEKTAKPSPAKMKGMLPVQVVKMEQSTQVGIAQKDKSTQAESHEFPADRVPDYVRWSTKP